MKKCIFSAFYSLWFEIWDLWNYEFVSIWNDTIQRFIIIYSSEMDNILHIFQRYNQRLIVFFIFYSPKMIEYAYFVSYPQIICNILFISDEWMINHCIVFEQNTYNHQSHLQNLHTFLVITKLCYLSLLFIMVSPFLIFILYS